MNILIIDTSSNQEIKVGLKINGKKYLKALKVDNRKAQVVLPIIDGLLNEHNITLKNIHKIEVNVGPGSFTGLRVGVSIANTLGFVLQIPVNDKEVGEIVQPIYE